MRSGPLSGLRVLEFAGLGPAPFCCMLLSDLGADVVRIDRGGKDPGILDAIILRGRRSIALDLKSAAGLQTARALSARADILIEGALEPQFFSELLTKTGLSSQQFPNNTDRALWPALRATLTHAFAMRPRSEWCAVFEGSDACFAPVLSMRDAPFDPHNVARQTFVHLNGVTQAAPAPRFSLTPGAIQGPTRSAGADTAAILRDWAVG